MTDNSLIDLILNADRERLNVAINGVLCGYGPGDPQWYSNDYVGAIEELEAQVALLTGALEEFCNCLKTINDKSETAATWGPRIEAAYRAGRQALATTPARAKAAAEVIAAAREWRDSLIRRDRFEITIRVYRDRAERKLGEAVGRLDEADD